MLDASAVSNENENNRNMSRRESADAIEPQNGPRVADQGQDALPHVTNAVSDGIAGEVREQADKARPKTYRNAGLPQ